MRQLWREQAAANQFGQVAVAHPGVQHAPVLGFGKGRANPQTGALYAVAVPIKLGYIFAKRLGQAVIGVWPAAAIGGQKLVLPMKAHHMVGAGKHHPLDAVAARPFIHMQHAFDVGFDDGLKRMLVGQAAEVDDGLAALRQAVNRLFVGQIADLKLFADPGRRHGGDVRQADVLDIGAQAAAQVAAEVAGGSGE